MFSKNLLGVITIGLALVAGPARAATLTLSQLSSDETDPSLLDATFDFIVSGSTLTLTVANDSAYQIHEIYFNATSDVESLTLTSPTSGWLMELNDSADGFGQFDFAILGARGVPRRGIQTILSGASETFTFTIIPADGASVDDLDFVTQLSTIPPGSRPSLGAAKFMRGPNDDSAFGATQDGPTPTPPGPPPVIPVPAAAPMGLALLAMIGLFRRFGTGRV